MELEQYTLEFPMKSTPKILDQFLFQPTGLQQWFADQVSLENGLITFNWSGEIEQAKLLNSKARKKIKWQWLQNKSIHHFCELSYSICSMTNETIVQVTDFASIESMEDSIQLWEHSFQKLKMKLGA